MTEEAYSPDLRSRPTFQRWSRLGDVNGRSICAGGDRVTRRDATRRPAPCQFAPTIAAVICVDQTWPPVIAHIRRCHGNQMTSDDLPTRPARPRCRCSRRAAAAAAAAAAANVDEDSDGDADVTEIITARRCVTRLSRLRRLRFLAFPPFVNSS